MSSNNFTKGKWIWTNASPQPDEYGEFYTSFDYLGDGAELLISADSNYAVYLNGQLAACGQYADYPYDKIYDVIDLSKYCHLGKNDLAITVWYIGTAVTSVYYPGRAALIFELRSVSQVLAASGRNTLSRISPTYKNHACKLITVQLGFSYAYDVSAEDGWTLGNTDGFSESVEVDQNLPLRPRPCERTFLDAPVNASLIKRISECDLLFDLGSNISGLLSINAISEQKQTVTVAYGEHIADGCVRRKVGGRDFSAELTLRAGESCYTNPFRRFGARYLEIHSECPLDVRSISLIPTPYPIKILPRPELDAQENAIYDICINSLLNCMHEHYEDCSWREQALYCMDSRNQMLAGYYAFGEYKFARANLELISKDNRRDGLLSICYPTANDLVIPSFSLHYFTQCAEYLEHSNDADFLREIYPKLESILSVFLDRGARDGELVRSFCGASYWNFYEWSRGLDNEYVWSVYRDPATPPSPDDELFDPDLILNLLISRAMRQMAKISCTLGIENTYAEMADRLNDTIRRKFYCPSEKLYQNKLHCKEFSILGNSLAILAGVSCGDEAKDICEIMIRDHSLTPISLSMRCFLYDALLMSNFEHYRDFVLADIARIYTPMVEYGTGTVWETECGESDFDRAGSLCHGWSAMPIYYFHTLK